MSYPITFTRIEDHSCIPAIDYVAVSRIFSSEFNSRGMISRW